MPISQSAPKQTSPVATVTDANISAFYDTLATCGTKPALLSIIPKFSSNYVAKRLLDAFPEPLSMLHKPAYMKLEYHELLEACEAMTVDITKEMALAIENETRLQSNLKLWLSITLVV